jgi:hypothetical protein
MVLFFIIDLAVFLGVESIAETTGLGFLPDWGFFLSTRSDNFSDLKYEHSHAAKHASTHSP